MSREPGSTKVNAALLEAYNKAIKEGKELDFPIRMKPEPEQVYSTITICKITGIQRERLRDWMTKGYIVPTIDAEHQGGCAIFTNKDLSQIMVFNKLVELGTKRYLASILAKKAKEIPRFEHEFNIHTIDTLQVGVTLDIPAQAIPEGPHNRYINDRRYTININSLLK